VQLSFLKIWDAILGRSGGRVEVTAAPVPRPAKRAAPRKKAPRNAAASTVVAERAPGAMAEKYDAMMRDLLETHGVRVRKWRKGMSGVAWSVRYRDGRVVRLIEAPKPVGPMSAAVFCHEIGHHAIGFDVYKPRCLEEYYAWAWALAEMERRGLNVTDKVRERMRKSLEYAVAKSLRRGIKSLPEEMTPYIEGARRFLR
jgi:hypothetical protein